jgi:hypothetical protein
MSTVVMSLSINGRSSIRITKHRLIVWTSGEVKILQNNWFVSFIHLLDLAWEYSHLKVVFWKTSKTLPATFDGIRTPFQIRHILVRFHEFNFISADIFYPEIANRSFFYVSLLMKTCMGRTLGYIGKSWMPCHKDVYGVKLKNDGLCLIEHYYESKGRHLVDAHWRLFAYIMRVYS